MEELKVADRVGDKVIDSVEDEDLDVESDRLAEEDDDAVRDGVILVVREGEAERETLWLWLNV